MSIAARKRRLGMSTVGCLLMIAITLGGSIWGYYTFIHYRPLVNAEKNVLVYTDTPETHNATLEYGRRFRDQYRIAVNTMLQTNQRLLTKLKRGEAAKDPALFQQNCSEFIENLLAGVSDFNAQQVPSVLKSSHVQMAKAYRCCYESALAMTKAIKAEGPDRKLFIQEAEKKYVEAYKAGGAGTAEHARVWQTLP
jgi:hypothetical protein